MAFCFLVAAWVLFFNNCSPCTSMAHDHGRFPLKRSLLRCSILWLVRWSPCQTLVHPSVLYRNTQIVNPLLCKICSLVRIPSRPLLKDFPRQGLFLGSRSKIGFEGSTKERAPGHLCRKTGGASGSRVWEETEGGPQGPMAPGPQGAMGSDILFENMFFKLNFNLLN